MRAPLCCDLQILNAADRQRRAMLFSRVREAMVQRRETLKGYVFRLDPARLHRPELHEWIALEGKCCPFLRFRITTGPEAGALWLHVTGRQGAKEVIRAEFL